MAVRISSAFLKSRICRHLHETLACSACTLITVITMSNSKLHSRIMHMLEHVYVLSLMLTPKNLLQYRSTKTSIRHACTHVEPKKISLHSVTCLHGSCLNVACNMHIMCNLTWKHACKLAKYRYFACYLASHTRRCCTVACTCNRQYTLQSIRSYTIMYLCNTIVMWVVQ